MKIFFISILLLLSGCSSEPYVVTVKQAAAYKPNGKHEIYVVSHGWHTGFVIPSADIYPAVPELEQRFKKTPYIEFGWGDEGFYQAREITSSLTVRAIFWPTESVVHSVAVPSDVPGYFPTSEIETVILNTNELASLVNFISGSFYKDETGKVLELKSGLYGNSRFYRGAGDYHLMNTCNNWTAKGLKSAGMNISVTFKLTADSIMDYLRRRRVQP